MAKINYIDIIDNVSGKFCKQDPNGAIFAHRKDTNTCYVYHRHNESTAPATAGQIAVRTRFAAAVAATNAAMEDPEQIAAYATAFKNQTKYKTLRGFIFAKEYAKL